MKHPLAAWINAALLAIVVALAVALGWQRGDQQSWRDRIAEVRQRRAEQVKAAAAAKRIAVPRAPARAAAAAVAATDKPVSPEAQENARIVAERREHLNELNTLTGYDRGFVALNLPPATVERAKQIILNEWRAVANTTKAMQAAHAFAGEDGWAARLAVDRQANQDLQDQLTGLLGADGYQQLEAYHRESRIDWTIGTDLWDAGAPLSSDQLHALALAEVQANYRDEPWPMPPSEAGMADPGTGLSAQDVALLTRSGRFLSAAQQEALRQSLIDEHHYNAAMQGFMTKQRATWEAARNGHH